MKIDCPFFRIFQMYLLPQGKKVNFLNSSPRKSLNGEQERDRWKTKSKG
jgi:hypothetical protein